MIRIQTTASSRVIRHALQALNKSKAISSAYKLQYAKHYTSDSQGRLRAQSVQIIVLSPSLSWTQSGERILQSLLKEFTYIDAHALHHSH